MSRQVSDKEQSNATFSILKRRKKPIVFMGLTLIFIAVILIVINLIYWNTKLLLISFLTPFMLGVSFILFGIEASREKEKGYKISLVSGILICIFSIIPFVKYLF